jgi:hypothetical protein
MDFAKGITDDARDAEHVLGGVDAGGLVGVLGLFMQEVHHRLGDGEVARGHEHQHPVVGALEGCHLAKGVDLIDTGVGP